MDEKASAVCHKNLVMIGITRLVKIFGYSGDHSRTVFLQKIRVLRVDPCTSRI